MGRGGNLRDWMSSCQLASEQARIASKQTNKQIIKEADKQAKQVDKKAQ